MALTITFHPQSMTADYYDAVIQKLEAAGQGNPKGRLFHSCYGPKTNLSVVDVWASQEDFDRFGAILMPILAGQGIDPGTPDIQPQHNSIVGR